MLLELKVFIQFYFPRLLQLNCLLRLKTSTLCICTYMFEFYTDFRSYYRSHAPRSGS